MSKTILHRPARMLPPPVPAREVAVAPPPHEQPRMGMTWWPQLLFPMVTILGSAYFIVYNPNPTYIAISLTMAFGSIALSLAMVLQQLSAGRHRVKLERERYLTYLKRLAVEARETARQQEDAARFAHPDMTGLWAIVGGRTRVWERRLEHPDFATARIGRGTVALATPFVLDGGGDPVNQRDPALQAALDQVVAEHRDVPGQPVLLDLRAHPVVSLVGPADVGRAVARNLVTELATFCAPDDLLLAVCHSPGGQAAWEFARWLPHVLTEDGGQLRLGEGSQVLAMLGEVVARRRERARRRAGAAYERRAGDEDPQPQLVVVVDGFSASSPLARLDLLNELIDRAGDLGVSLVFLVDDRRDEPPRVDVRVRFQAGDAFIAEDAHGNVQQGWVDRGDPVVADGIARELAPLQLGEREAAAALTDTSRLVEMLGADSARALEPAGLWRSRPAHDLLRVPIGVGADGSRELLDLKEAAQGGMGPHGLVIGATGSGKSELLRTLVTALAVTHSPETLGFVLVDFKGGAAFAGLAELPHVAGMITNLANDLTMVDRMYSALFGEMQRRQTLLRAAGNLDSVTAYQQQRADGLLPGAEPLPYLLIVVDEFGELLASRPDFIELFVAIGRVGRSLGMHLLLASQRLEEGRLRGLESHLSYRICLRTFSAAESQAAIGCTDAYHLPSVPGSAYLKVHTEVFERFRAAMVSGPDRGDVPKTAEPVTQFAFVKGLAAPSVQEVPAPAPVSLRNRPSEMAVAVERVRATGAAPVHQVWLPPLAPELALARLLPAAGLDEARGVQAVGWRGLGSMRVPIGLVDLPMRQAQRPFLVDFTGWAGHLAVVGAPQTGKSTFLRTLVLSLLVTHTPDEVRVYGVDYGGGLLFSLAGAPHVGDVAGRLDPEKMRRTVDHVWSLVDEREARFRELGIDSPETLRRRRAEGSLPPDVASDVLLVIDGWGALREEGDDVEAQVRDIAARGLRVACHVVLTANRWTEVRPNLRDLISGRLELRLNDPSESEIDRRSALTIPVGVPGRGLTPERAQLQVALPDLGAPLEQAVAAAAQAWPGAGAPAVRMLPSRVTPADLPAPAPTDGHRVPIGVEETDLAPVWLDLGGGDPHFQVFGDSESGKTTFLRSWLTGLQARKGPGEAMFLVVDYRRTLLGAVSPEQTWAYCGAAPQADASVRELAGGIVERLPPANLPPEAIASRSWWSGPEFYVVVDDYDLVASSAGNPLAPLVDLLAQGRDLGLHVVVARRVGGMARGGFEPLLSRLRDLHAPGLILSGDPSEGPILGMHRATSQVPGRGLLVRRRQRPVLVQAVDAVGAPTS